VQARSHVEALRIARRFEEIRVRSPTLEHAKRFAQEIGATATSAEEAVRDAEVIVTVTSSKTPVFKGAWLKVGAHVNAIGTCRPDWRELDNSSVGRPDAECLFVKLDRELITHAENFAMVFAAIRNALFAQQFRVDLVPPRLGIGEDAVEIEDHSAERLRHGNCSGGLSPPGFI